MEKNPGITRTGKHVNDMLDVDMSAPVPGVDDDEAAHTR